MGILTIFPYLNTSSFKSTPERITFPLVVFLIPIYGIISFLFLSQLKSLCPINPATLTWCCGFLGSVMITALENEESRVCRLVSLLVIVQSLLFWDHRSDFVNLGMSHLARYSLEGHNRYVVSFPVVRFRFVSRPPKSKQVFYHRSNILGTTRNLWSNLPHTTDHAKEACHTPRFPYFEEELFAASSSAFSEWGGRIPRIYDFLDPFRCLQ